MACGVPQIKFRIEFTAQAFDVKEGLLQQHQLRLDFDMEAPGSLKQAHQYHAQRDFLERPIKVGLAHRTNRGLQFVHTCCGRHPARFNVQLALCACNRV